MNLTGRILFSLIFSLAPFSVFSQTDSSKHSTDSTAQNNLQVAHIVTTPPVQNIGTLTGTLVDAHKKPVSYATATLLRSWILLL